MSKFSLNSFLNQISHEERERRLKTATCSTLSGPTRAPWFQCKFNSDKIIEPCEQATGNYFLRNIRSGFIKLLILYFKLYLDFVCTDPTQIYSNSTGNCRCPTEQYDTSYGCSIFQDAYIDPGNQIHGGKPTLLSKTPLTGSKETYVLS